MANIKIKCIYCNSEKVSKNGKNPNGTIVTDKTCAYLFLCTYTIIYKKLILIILTKTKLIWILNMQEELWTKKMRY